MEGKAVRPLLDSIFVHIGFHKCGSTAIQWGLAQLSDKLRDQGIYFPEGNHALVGSFFANSREDFFHNLAFGRNNRDRAKGEDRAYMEGVWAGVSDSRCHTLVFSYEGFPNLSRHEVEHLVRVLSEKARRVIAVAYCRHPLSFAPSEISQRARSGVSTDVISAAPPLLNFKTSLPKFVNAVGLRNFIARDFDRRRLHEGDVVCDFLSLLPGGSKLIAEAPRLRPDLTKSLSQEAVILAGALKALESPGLPIFRLGGIRTLQDFLGALDGIPVRLDQEEKEFLLKKSAEHLEYLETTFGLRLLEPVTTSQPEQERLFGNAFVASLARALKPLIEAKERSASLDRVKGKDD